MYIPKLIKNDPWLEPFSETIINRLKRASAKERELLTGAGSLSEFASSGHEYFGLHRQGPKRLLREWAPNARAVWLLGEFSDWEARDEFAFQGAGGVWEFVVPDNLLKHLDLYKLKIAWDGGQAERIPAWARRVVQDEQTKIFTAQVWEPEKPYQWKIPDFVPPFEFPIIYEAHIGMGGEDEKVSSYDEFRRNVLPRVKAGGYNTIQLMAIQEHPYYGSFGYHVSSFFAASSRFGTPDELRHLIDEAHSMGIAVIMDIIHSHAVKNELEGLSRYDGTLHQFFHEGARGEHPAWDSRCFNYAKREVLRFLLSNCKFWLEEYKFDGYRFDGVTSMIYLDHGLGRSFDAYDKYFDGGQDDDALVYLILANRLIHQVKPSAITIAEEMSGMPGLASPIEYGGYGFDYRLSMGVPDYWIKIIKEKKDEDWNVEEIFYELTRRRVDEKVVSYAESHDQALVGDKTIIFRLIDQEMYWHMATDHQNLVVDRGIALHKMIRMVTLTTAGNGYLNFMGNEFGHPEWIDFPREGNGWSYKYARRQWSLVDNDLLRYKQLNRFDQHLLACINANRTLCEPFPWLIMKHTGDQVLVFRRNGLYFVFNFNPNQSFTDYAFEVEEGQYEIVLNSDALQYGGFGRVDDEMHYTAARLGQEYYDPWMLRLYLPNRSALIIKKISNTTNSD